MMTIRLLTVLVLGCLSSQDASRPADVTFTRVHALAPEEGVFAYARISPDGQRLAYASEMPRPGGGIATTQTVVDLVTKRRVFAEPGIDAYFSVDGGRLIFLSQATPTNVSILDNRTGALTRQVAPVALGDYFSWAKRDGRDLILTIQSQYYYLEGDKAVLPAGRVVPCDGIGVGDRPLISKDGRRVTTFVRGAVVVRSLTDCEFILNTGLQGAKADFSFDGRYVAFHTPRPNTRAYDIVVVDTEQRTVRTVTNLPGSSLFPSWTKDGRLCFRYDGDDYRGFVMAEHVLRAPERPLPVRRTAEALVPESPRWQDLFPESALPSSQLALVMVWASWSAHAPDALTWLQRAGKQFAERATDVQVLTAVEPASRRVDVDRLRRQRAITLDEIVLAPGRFRLTEAVNQIPATLLFRDGRLVDRRLGAQTPEQLQAWVDAARR